MINKHSYLQKYILITFRDRHSKREMDSDHPRLCVCVCVLACVSVYLCSCAFLQYTVAFISVSNFGECIGVGLPSIRAP